MHGIFNETTQIIVSIAVLVAHESHRIIAITSYLDILFKNRQYENVRYLGQHSVDVCKCCGKDI